MQKPKSVDETSPQEEEKTFPEVEEKTSSNAQATGPTLPTSSGAPPPPPPLPPPAPGLPPPPPVSSSGSSEARGGDIMSQIAKGSTGLKKAPTQIEKPVDEREGLLGAIRKGKQLKKVTPEMMQKPEKKKDPSNAAELLAMAMDSRV